MELTAEQQAALAEFDRASKKISTTGAGKAAPGVEVAYNMAYKNLVRLGLREKLRGRYNV